MQQYIKELNKKFNIHGKYKMLSGSFSSKFKSRLKSTFIMIASQPPTDKRHLTIVLSDVMRKIKVPLTITFSLLNDKKELFIQLALALTL